MATLDPFQPWKRAARVWNQAKALGFEIVVALDDRTSAEDQCVVRQIADQVVLWKSEGHVEDAYEHVSRCSNDFVLMIADDEEPSALCWEFSSDPPFPARYAFPVLPVINGKMYSIDVGLQERLIYKPGWAWIPRMLPDGSMTTFEGRPDGARQIIIKDNPGAVIWHYLLEAPRSERESKASRYAVIDQSTVDLHLRRLAWEDHPEYLVDIPAPFAAMLPKENS